MLTTPWPCRPLLPHGPPTPARWRTSLATLLRRWARRLLAPQPMPRHPPQLEFHDGTLYADGVRIGTLAVRRL